MRHHPLFLRQQREQTVIDLDPVERRQPQPLQRGHMVQNAFDQLAERRRTGQIGAITGEIDPGQHHFAVTSLDQCGDAIDRGPGRDRAAVAAPLRDDAEGAAMVAAILNFDKGAGVRAESGGEVGGGFAHHRDIADQHAIGRGPGVARKFFGIAEYTVNLGHRSKGCGVDLRRAPSDDDLGTGPVGAGAADGLARFGDGGVGDRATVDDDHIPPRSKRADRFALGDVQAAAKADDLGIGHCGRSRSGCGRSPCTAPPDVGDDVSWPGGVPLWVGRPDRPSPPATGAARPTAAG
ncbi:hypothetical protein D9M73_113960 [compost metagenome]